MSARKIRRGVMLEPEYNVWSCIVQRCTNPNYNRYADYGGRGITLCESWRTSYTRFRDDLRSSIGPRVSRDYSLDRIDNERGYEPGNVRWATRSEQQRNSRRTHLMKVNGETLPIVEWAQRTGVAQGLILTRLNRGWTPERAITKPRWSRS